MSNKLEETLAFLNDLRKGPPEEAILKLLEGGPLKMDELLDQLTQSPIIPGSPMWTAALAALEHNFGRYSREDYEQATAKLFAEKKIVIDWKIFGLSLPEQK